MINQISADERKREFYGVEGAVFVEYPDDNGNTVSLSSSYIPTDMSNVKKETGISIFAITQAKLKGGMYPWQQRLARILGSKKEE